MFKKYFSKSYWGFNWEQNLLTLKKLDDYSKETLQPLTSDLDSGAFEKYKSILDDLLSDEKERLVSIESKALQIVGQVSIVTTIVGLFAPFVLDKVSTNHQLLRIILIIGILIIALLFVYSIVSALRNLYVSRFIYAKASEENILQHHNGKLPKINYQIINDKIIELKASQHSNNAKASNVIYSVRAFKAAMVVMVIYIIGYTTVLFFVPEAEQKVVISSESIREINRKPIPLNSTIRIIIDSSNSIKVSNDKH